MSWLNDHFEKFVIPHLGFDPRGITNRPYDPRIVSPTFSYSYFTAQEKTVIKNCWKSVKKEARGRKILLAGRDVFIFEILARRENYPTIFIPQCSRQTVRDIHFPEEMDLFLFDTGFVGSIPNALGISTFKLMSYAQMNSVEKQVFPRLTRSRGLALKIESTPKYWSSARMQDGAVFQEFSDNSEFLRAAYLTSEIYKDSSPHFVTERQPIGRRLQWTL